MAVHKIVDGFEVPETMTRGQNTYYVRDIQKARSGSGYFKFKRNTVGTLESQVQHALAMGLSGAQAVQAGQRGQIRMRIYLRGIGLPTADMALWGFSVTGPSACGIILKTDGTLSCLVNNTQGPATAVAVAVVTDNDFDKWYRLDFNCQLTEAGGADTIVSSLTVTAPNGTTSTVGHSQTAALGATLAVTAFRLTTGLAANGVVDIDLDDFVAVVATNADVAQADSLPTETRVAAIFPAAQGSEADWTGEWWKATKVIIDNTGNNRQTTAGAGKRTTFTHANQPAANWGMTSIGGVMLTAVGRSTAVTTQKFRLGGVSFDAEGTTSNGLPSGGWVYYCDHTTRTPAALNSLEFGFESVDATTNDLYGIHMQVLYAGDAHSVGERDAGGYRHEWVTWTGDGTGHRLISVGFHPHAVLFCSSMQAAGSPTGPLWKFADMPGRYCYSSTGALELESLAEIDPDGFTIGLDVNGVGNRYTALVVRDDGDGSGGRIFHHGSVAHPSANTLAQTLGYPTPVQLDLLMVSGLASDTFVQTADFAANTSARLDGAVALPTDGILSRDVNGFTLGANLELVEADEVRHFWGWKFTAALAGLVQVGKVPGQSAAAVVLTVGMNPYAVFVRGSNTTTASKRFHEAEFIGGANSSTWASGAVTRANAITALDSVGGSFTIPGGAGAGIHLDDAPVVDAYWIAVHADAAVPPDTEVTGLRLGGIALVWVNAFLPD